jgi:hypothetical protein
VLYRNLQSKEKVMGRPQTAVYMLTTSDIYELPVMIGTPTEVAAWLGAKRTSVSSSVCKGSAILDKNGKDRYRCIKIKEEK